MDPIPVPASPEFLGFSVVTLTLVISLLSFAIAMVALVWQIVKHFLDGGRVRVSLNAAIWEPDFMLATNRSGRLLMKNGNAAKAVVRGRALEVAQLVVENPGRIPVTVYSPGLSFSGHGKKKHSVAPRMFATDGAYGPDDALTDNIVRIEPYGRATFLLDLWSVMPGILKDTPKDEVVVRGQVDVAGKRRPRRSAWRRRWKIRSGMYTAIEGEPDFTPYAVIWGVMFRQLPKYEDAQRDRHPNSGVAVSRGQVGFLLDEVMSRFEERPEQEQFKEAMAEAAEKHGEKFPSCGLATLCAYQELDRMQDHLTEWTEGLFRANREKRKEQAESEAEVKVEDSP
ncbi:hypothetical protein [Brachybacterium sp. p3-SID957]|uniref:hypothetical protein n=1 Tax=Brachybacterium sp. p3-SID957 TaxID=2916049 RepID=UPI00223A9D81|nr:hypothetical protein [Brachybacterium sp. p3-SID957]MCT1776224.1 hypothetical protein [Brachybacterium sp. p3-SID957]